MYNDNNAVPLLHLDPWDCFRHILTSFSLDSSGYGLLTFQSDERILILIRNKEMADDIQQHIGSVITILRTEDPDNEWLYCFNDNNKKEDLSKKEQSLQPIPMVRITEDVNTTGNIKQSEEGQVKTDNLATINKESNIRHLQLWDEVEGRLRRISTDNGIVNIIFYGDVTVPIANPDKVLIRKLQSASGKIISLLCTNIPSKTYLLKIKRNKKATGGLTFIYKDSESRLGWYLSNLRNRETTKTTTLPAKNNVPPQVGAAINTEGGRT